MCLMGRSAQQIHTLWTKNLSMSRFWGAARRVVKPAKPASTHESKFRCPGEATGPKKAKKMPGFPSLGFHLVSAPEWDRQSNSGVPGADAHSAVVLILCLPR